MITSLVVNSMDFVCTNLALPSQSADVAHSPSCHCGDTERFQAQNILHGIHIFDQILIINSNVNLALHKNIPE